MHVKLNFFLFKARIKIRQKFHTTQNYVQEIISNRCIHC